MLKKYWLCWVVMAVVVVLDQVTKIIVRQTLEVPLEVIPGFFELHYVENPGAAFGLFRDIPKNIRLPIFAAASIVAVGGLTYLLAGVPPRLRYLVASFGAVLGGAVGNGIDRFARGTVTDFFEFSFGSYTWPNFNIADAGISIGITIICLDLVFGSGLIPEEFGEDASLETGSQQNSGLSDEVPEESSFEPLIDLGDD